MMKGRVLVVEDEGTLRDLTCEFLKTNDYDVDSAESAANAIKMIKQRHYDIILTDKNIPGGKTHGAEGGMEVLKFAHEYAPNTETILLTGYGSIENAVEAMKLGAHDYIKKPFKLDELLVKIERAMTLKKLIEEIDFKDDILEQGKEFVFKSLKRRTNIIYQQKMKLEKISQYLSQLKDVFDNNDEADNIIKNIEDTLK